MDIMSLQPFKRNAALGAAFRGGSRSVVSRRLPSLKIGRYIAITRPPTSTPRITMISGSSRLDIASTALSTSAS